MRHAKWLREEPAKIGDAASKARSGIASSQLLIRAAELEEEAMLLKTSAHKPRLSDIIGPRKPPRRRL
jgi:hypothetical protein